MRVPFSAFVLGVLLALAGVVFPSGVSAERSGQVADAGHWQIALIAPSAARFLVVVPDQADDGLPPTDTRDEFDLISRSRHPISETVKHVGPEGTFLLARGPPGLAI